MYINIQHNTYNINNYKQTVVNTIFYLNAPVYLTVLFI
jgi:hypothetical protein